MAGAAHDALVEDFYNAIQKAKWEGGGYDEFRILNRSYPQGEDRQFKRDLKKLAEEGKINLEDGDQRAKVYMLPTGQFCADGCDVDYTPFGLMHTLTRKTANNYWYHHPKLLRGREVDE